MANPGRDEVKEKGRREKRVETRELKKFVYCMLYKFLIIGSESTLFIASDATPLCSIVNS